MVPMEFLHKPRESFCNPYICSFTVGALTFSKVVKLYDGFNSIQFEL